MAKYTYINGDLSALADILNDSGYFDSVVYTTSNPNYTITCKIGTKTVFTWQGQYTGGSGASYKFDIAVYGDTPSFVSNVTSGGYNAYLPSAVYECSGGIAIYCWYGRVVITKNQRGETMVVFNSKYTATSSTVTNMETIGAIAYTDRGTYYDFKMNTNTCNQTQLIPICSCSGFDEKSYTETALVATYKQYSSIGFIVYNNKRYFYDGYFAIEDEMVED